MSRKIKKKEISDEKKNKIYKKIKREFIFEHLVYANYYLLLNSSRDFRRLKLLQFDFRSDLFLFSLSLLNIPTIYAFVRRPRRTHAFFWNIRRKNRWDIDGSLGISALYIVAECRRIFISINSPSDLKRVGCDTCLAIFFGEF